MGKYKNREWEKIDQTETNKDMDYLEGEYKLAFGQGWMFKRIEE